MRMRSQKMRKNKIIVLLFVALSCSFAVDAQSNRLDANLVTPLGSKCSVLTAENKMDVMLLTKKNGDVLLLKDSIIQEVGIEGNSVILPQGILPTSACTTNDGKIIVQCQDTVYLIDEKLNVYPILHMAYPISMRAVGLSDFAFMAIHDTVVYRYSFKDNSINVVFSTEKAINDFVVDGEDYYFATDSVILVYSEEKVYLPLLSDSKIINRINVSSFGFVLFSTKDGLWIVNHKREKICIYGLPVLDIVLDEYDRLFFKLLDNTWVYLFPMSSYDKLFD